MNGEIGLMVVSGLLIITLPEKLGDVKKELSTINGLEIQNIIDDCKIVVVIESEIVEDGIVISREIAKMDGVLSINLAYHHFEDEALDA